MLYFAFPGITILYIEVRFCSRDGLTGFWETILGLVKQSQDLFIFPVQSIIGLALVIIGFIFLLVGQITLWRSYSSTLVIREDHQFITNGIYRFTRNPMYLGGIMVVTGLPVYAASLYGFLTSLILTPIILIRIRIEEELLAGEFQAAYQKYKQTT